MQKFTSRESSQLMALGKRYIKVGYKSMNVIVTFCYELERSSKGSITGRHFGNIHCLSETNQIMLSIKKTTGRRAGSLKA